MERRVFGFFFLILLIFSLVSYLVMQSTLDKLSIERQNQQLEQYRVIRHHLQTSYRLLDELLRNRSVTYKALHQDATRWLARRTSGTSLSELQQQLISEAGFPVDIFVISDDLIITESTFPPDQGLDFRLPAFIHVQNYLRAALERQETLVSIPTLELTSGQYKLYTYSPLPSGGYLELGFVDPEVNAYFQSYIEQSRSHQGVDIKLFIDIWDSTLMQLGLPPQPDGVDKTELIQQQEQVMRAERRHFQNMVPGQVTTAHNSEGYRAQVYDVLLSLEPFPDVTMRILSKVTFTDSEFVQLQQRVRNFSLIMLGLAVLVLFGLMFLVRFHLVRPITSLVNAIRNAQEIDIAHSSSIPELKFLASNYNQMLEKNRAQLIKLESLSLRDPLTDLYNRRHLESVMHSELARAKRHNTVVAFAMLDVDCFKSYNDIYGHQDGDLVLRRLAKLMQNYFRRAGDFVFRYGGEEFALLVTDTPDPQMIARFEELRVLIDQAQLPHEGSNVVDHITVSIGICLTDDPSLYNPDQLIFRADQALYEAKRAGRNRVMFSALDKP
ncbi:GGDEF domain-containing protein [Aestuariirhabdus sp. Z084]|uniref:GGDEF domain-containing protein n=1 Tax=Aestuariirhabdus haliotis TaxID=2918751 RepID=UPI00201B3C02|nr:GGDEF domain-containing protein [Aestuariirhabdus haliotis]MCL6417055.1 GGDEF domain-containing protein [Aestuariirhabdus haliotis]MCL6420966.1 GGDEF domain-containing protein [Aestuariirhabdus haliotis]